MMISSEDESQNDEIGIKINIRTDDKRSCIKNDSFLEKARSYVDQSQFSIVEEISNEIERPDQVIIPPTSCLLLRLERGDLSLSPVKFTGSNVSYMPYNRWFKKVVLDNPENKEICEKAGIFRAMHCSTVLHMHKDDHSLLSLLARWNSKRHTFLTSWGHITPTLLDVNEILGLSILGTEEYCDDDVLTDKDKEIVRSLGRAFKEPNDHTKRNSSGAWIRYWLGEYDLDTKQYSGGPGGLPDDEIQLAALVVLWLSRFIFEGPPFNGIAKRLFPIAARLSQGAKLPLAPMFLASLYKRLDEFVFYTERSKGSHCVVSFISVAFIQVWLYELVPACAPAPRRLRPVPLHHVVRFRHRAERWSNVPVVATTSWPLFFDDIKNICFRPYLQHRDLTFPSVCVPSHEKNYSLLDRKNVEEVAATFACVSQTHWLKTMVEYDIMTWKNKLIMVEYYPQDVAAFLGLPQRFPQPFLKEDLILKADHLYDKGLYHGFGSLSSVHVPGIEFDRPPVFTTAYGSFLRHQLSRWEDFVKSTPVAPKKSSISKVDCSYLTKIPIRQRKEPAKNSHTEAPILEVNTSCYDKAFSQALDPENATAIAILEEPILQEVHGGLTNLQQVNMENMSAPNVLEPFEDIEWHANTSCVNNMIIPQENSFFRNQSSNTFGWDFHDTELEGTSRETTAYTSSDTFHIPTTTGSFQQLMEGSNRSYTNQSAVSNCYVGISATIPPNMDQHNRPKLLGKHPREFQEPFGVTELHHNLQIAGCSNGATLLAKHPMEIQEHPLQLAASTNPCDSKNAVSVVAAILEREPTLYEKVVSSQSVQTAEAILLSIVLHMANKTTHNLNHIIFLTSSVDILQSIGVSSTTINQRVEEAKLFFKEKQYTSKAMADYEAQLDLSKQLQERKNKYAEMKAKLKAEKTEIEQMEKKAIQKQAFNYFRSARSKLDFNESDLMDYNPSLQFDFSFKQMG